MKWHSVSDYYPGDDCDLVFVRGEDFSVATGFPVVFYGIATYYGDSGWDYENMVCKKFTNDSCFDSSITHWARIESIEE